MSSQYLNNISPVLVFANLTFAICRPGLASQWVPFHFKARGELNQIGRLSSHLFQSAPLSTSQRLEKSAIFHFENENISLFACFGVLSYFHLILSCRYDNIRREKNRPNLYKFFFTSFNSPPCSRLSISLTSTSHTASLVRWVLPLMVQIYVPYSSIDQFCRR